MSRNSYFRSDKGYLKRRPHICHIFNPFWAFRRFYSATGHASTLTNLDYVFLNGFFYVTNDDNGLFCRQKGNSYKECL